MDIKSRELISKQFSDLVQEHQGGMKSIHSTKSNYLRKHQDLKFSYVNNYLKESDSLLDVGCGLGDLCVFCRKNGWKGKYTGLDISDKMIEFTQKRLTNDDILEVDILEDDYQDKHDVVVSISTIQQEPLYDNGEKYLKNMIEKMFILSKKIIIFDVFSNKFVDHIRKGNLYVDPLKLLDYCYTLSNRLILINEYNPFQIMIILHKESSKGWVL